MSTATVLDKQINNYLVQLNMKQKRAVLSVVKTFAVEKEQKYSPWEDESFVAEMDKRVAGLESGKVKGHTWEEVKRNAKQSQKPGKKK
jgi:hypothetical protein